MNDQPLDSQGRVIHERWRGHELEKSLQEGNAVQHYDKPGIIIINVADPVLKMMVLNNLQLKQDTRSKAIWLHAMGGDSTQIMVGWNVKRRLMKLGQIKHLRTADYTATYEASKVGERYIRPSEKKEIKKAKPKISTRKVKAVPAWWPRTFAVDRKKDYKDISGTGWVIHGTVFSDGKCMVYWANTGGITMFDSFKEFEETHLRGKTHGISEIAWLHPSEESLDREDGTLERHQTFLRSVMKEKEEVEPPEEEEGKVEPPEEKKGKKEDTPSPRKNVTYEPQVCFYCGEAYSRSIQGKRPWRWVCKANACRNTYAGDLSTKKSLKQNGIDTSNL